MHKGTLRPHPGLAPSLLESIRTLMGGGFRFVPADKDSDGDFDPLTAAAWEDSTKSGTGTINLNTVFGVPTAARAVVFAMAGHASSVSRQFKVQAKSTTTKPSGSLRPQVVGVINDAHPVVAIAVDGTIYYDFVGGAWDLFVLRVVGWYV